MPTPTVAGTQTRHVDELAGGRHTLVSLSISAGAAVSIIALALLPLLTPWFMHPALDLSGSAGRLGVDAATARELSDRSVHELLLGPGTFAFSGPDGGPLYDAAERSHLADARALLWAWLLAGASAGLAIGLALARGAGGRRAARWRAVSRGGAATAIGVVALGTAGLIAFGPLFELFHRVFFPGGNWAFDPTSQRLVQLYPVAFWQVAAAALGVLAAGLGLGTWWLGRRMATRASREGASTA